MEPLPQSPITLSDADRARIAGEYELLMEYFARRHGISTNDISDTVKWVKMHRDWLESMKRGFSLALIGFFASALLLALWEGIKTMVRRG